MQLRQYQQDAVDETIGSIAFGSENIIIEAPTGAGKSLIISELCKQLDGTVVILVNITSLIDQISEHLTELGLEHSILKSGRDEDYAPDSRIHIFMSQTFYSRYKDMNIHAQYIIQDERHKEYDTERTKTAIKELNASVVIGLTATPYDAEGFAFDDADIVKTICVKDLEDQKFLSPIKYYVPKWSEQIDYSSVKKSGNDYATKDLDEIINTHNHLTLAVKSMDELNAKEKKTIVFCSSIEQCDNMNAILQANGYDSFSYHSKVDKKIASEAMNAFKTNGVYDTIPHSEKTLINNASNLVPVKCICAVSKLSTGFDVRDIELGVQLRPTKVRSLYIQQVGRLTRTSEGKEYAEYLDLGQTLSRFGFHNDDYLPLTRTGTRKDDLELMKKDSEPTMNLAPMLDDEMQEVTIEFYNLKLKEFENLKRKSFDSMTIKELATRYEITESIEDIISIGSKIMTLKFGKPISKAGMPYDYNAKWLSELVEPALEKYPEMTKMWTRAYRTRVRNIIKQNKNFNAVRFFIEYLVEEHEKDLDLQEAIYNATEIEYEFDYDLEIPF